MRDVMTGVVRLTANGSETRNGTSFSAALGLNGNDAFPPVGGAVRGVASATVWTLLSQPYVDAGHCSPHPRRFACPEVFAAHPEWFVCQPDVKCTAAQANTTDASHACWSVPSLQQQLIASVRRMLQSSPASALISVSGMDGGMDNPNTCDGDHALNVAENTTGGANWHAVNAVAKAIASDFPRATIETLAYQGGEAPPATLRFESNVVTMITLNEEMQPAGHMQRGRYDRFLPLSDKQNTGAVQLLRDWIEAMGEGSLWVWDHAESGSDTMIPV